MHKPHYLLLVLLCICNNPAYGYLPDSLEQRMDAILQRYIGDDRPGAAIGIIDNMTGCILVTGNWKAL